MKKEIYQMISECNDRGWVQGNKFMETPEEALKMMRDYVAYKIRYERSQGVKVSNLHVWKDNVMNTVDNIPSQSITFKAGDNFWDFRISACEVWDKYERPSWW